MRVSNNPSWRRFVKILHQVRLFSTLWFQVKFVPVLTEEKCASSCWFNNDA